MFLWSDNGNHYVSDFIKFLLYAPFVQLLIKVLLLTC